MRVDRREAMKGRAGRGWRMAPGPLVTQERLDAEIGELDGLLLRMADLGAQLAEAIVHLSKRVAALEAENADVERDGAKGMATPDAPKRQPTPDPLRLVRGQEWTS